MRTLGGFAGLSCTEPESTDAVSARRAEEDLGNMAVQNASGAKSTGRDGQKPPWVPIQADRTQPIPGFSLCALRWYQEHAAAPRTYLLTGLSPYPYSPVD